MSAKKRILNILFWSVISAAFIGPGTITTAARSGSAYGTDLLWALLFSTAACLVLQEAASRISIITGKNLGQSIAGYFGTRSSGTPVLILVLGAILVGTAAYEMGNLMGAVAGLQLVFDIPAWILVLATGVSAAILLSIPSLKKVSTILGILVVIMGISFLLTAIMVRPSFTNIVRGTFIPSFPGPEAGMLVLALIGTTIVPYNLFLGSGLSSSGQSLKEMRFGLGTAIILGGIFSMAVLIVGSAVDGIFSFDSLAAVLETGIGPAGKYLLGFGLFAAGFTSAVTAPLAAAITLRSLFGQPYPEKWKAGSWRFRSGWLSVLLAGVIFASLNFRPVPAIIIAQALNGFLLPFISIFLFIIIRKSIQKRSLPVRISSFLMLAVIFITLIIGLNSAVKAVINLVSEGSPVTMPVQIIIVCFSLALVVMVGLAGRQMYNNQDNNNRMKNA
ncbi:MAG: Nramp family divalent metal transporter [Bacteroidales bacterium]